MELIVNSLEFGCHIFMSTGSKGRIAHKILISFVAWYYFFDTKQSTWVLRNSTMMLTSCSYPIVVIQLGSYHQNIIPADKLDIHEKTQFPGIPPKVKASSPVKIISLKDIETYYNTVNVFSVEIFLGLKFGYFSFSCFKFRL